MTDDSDPQRVEKEHKCPDCGITYIGLRPLRGHNCPKTVPIEKLEQLADEWERRYKENAEYPPYDIPAKELREVIADYE